MKRLGALRKATGKWVEIGSEAYEHRSEWNCMYHYMVLRRQAINVKYDFGFLVKMYYPNKLEHISLYGCLCCWKLRSPLSSSPGVKVTSSVQVPKLLKQAGERVEVLYERPVRHQSHPLGNLGPLHEGLSHLEDPTFLGPQGPSGYEEDPAPISTVPDILDSKEIDSEFEELMVDSKPSPTSSPGGANPPDAREDFLLTVNQSPKRAVANLASISPILNRKLLLVGLQSPLKPQPKEPPKPSLPKGSVDPLESGPQRPTVPPPPPPTRPPVPPRPQIKLTTASSETSLLEVTDLTPATSAALATATTTFSIASTPCPTRSRRRSRSQP